MALTMIEGGTKGDYLMVRSSRLGVQEPVRGTMLARSHQLLFTISHTLPSQIKQEAF